jgi:predicted PurR-regulated permease PerM
MAAGQGTALAETAAGDPMAAPRSPFHPWIVFAGAVLAVFVLDWAETLLLPIAVALLLTFLLNPPVTWLQRWIRRGPAVIVVVTFTIATLTFLGWVLTRQVASLAAELPNYRVTIREKILDIRRAARGGPVEKVQETLEDIKQDIATAEQGIATAEARRVPAPTPVVVTSAPASGLGLPLWTSPLLDAAGMAGLVTVLLIFMLLEQRDMRDRIVGLIGIGRIASATKALDEAAERLSRYLLMQSLVNVIYGVAVGVGLWWLGVPYPVLWGALGAVLRFIPYAGPWIAATAPILVSFASQPEWSSTVYVVVLFIALELFTNMVLETVLYAGAAGVTQTALIVAVAFWTWLWGPIGLLLATPLTVCLVVLGKHVRGLNFIATLIADEPVLTRGARFYQRLLAHEPQDARLIAQECVSEKLSHAELADELFRPALRHLERDVAAGRLTDEEAAEVRTAASAIAEELGAEWPGDVAPVPRVAV